MLTQLKKELLKALKTLKLEGDKVYDPSELNISARELGGKVELIQGDDTLATAPDGDYTLSDGFKFTVKDGLIASIIDKSTEETFADESELAVGDEVTMSEDSADFLPWFKGVNFYVYSVDASYGVSLATKSGRYITGAKSESLTKTGNKIEFPKDELHFEENPAPEANSTDELKSAIEELKTTTEQLKQEIEAIKATIEELKGNVEVSATKEEVQQFSKDVQKLNSTIVKLSKLPVEPSKTTKSNIVKETIADKKMEAISFLKSKN